MRRPTCDECGAALAEHAERCSLCGWPVAAEESNAEGVSLQKSKCGRCSWKNSAVARYCSQCGNELLLEDAPPEARSRDAAVPRQVGIVVGAALALVVALFLISAVSKSKEPARGLESPQAQVSGAAILGSPLAEQVAELDDKIAQAAGSERRLWQREKLVVLIEAGRTDLAAAEQQRVAEATGALQDWNMAGDLYYDAMSEATVPNARQSMANLAVAAYERMLQLDPEDLDVRTDMATAYLNTGNPMKGVDEIKRVLESDPMHLNANFNYGLMLARINRADKAVEQLEKVLTLTEEGSEHYLRASEVLAALLDQEGL